MPRIDIRTRLGFCPKPKAHEIQVITRGATASLNYPLFDKVYTMDNIDQFTYIFRQGKNMAAFNMVEYFAETADTVVKSYKVYYERKVVNIPEQSYYKFEVKELEPGTSMPADIYEECELASGETNENWQFNHHFTYESGKDYAYINFMLTPDETAQMQPTSPDCNVQCEAVIRLNTDSFSGMHGEDSVIIEPQHPIAIVDSLFGKLIYSPLASELTYSNEKLKANN